MKNLTVISALLLALAAIVITTITGDEVRQLRKENARLWQQEATNAYLIEQITKGSIEDQKRFGKILVELQHQRDVDSEIFLDLAALRYNAPDPLKPGE